LILTARGLTTAPAAETIEVFVDDKPVHVEPGCTVLQVLTVLCVYVGCVIIKFAVKPHIRDIHRFELSIACMLLGKYR